MLCRVREKAGLTGDALAHRLGWSPSTVSRMETGRRPSTTTDVIQYTVMCGTRLSEVEPILEFTRMAEHQEGYYLSDKRIDGSLQSLIFHESSAAHSIIYEPQVIHGLVQTPEYARYRRRARHRGGPGGWRGANPDGTAADSVPAESSEVHLLHPRARTSAAARLRPGHA